MANGDAYDVFISYARCDSDSAAELNGWLCAQGLTTFFDRSALRPGLRWVSALEEAIGRCKATAILVGQHGIGNTQQYERELALIRQTSDANFPVIPVLMPGCDSPPTGFLQLLTWVDLSKGTRVLEQAERLADLRAALQGKAVAASAVRASICPYRGLEPFREEDASFFCGRDDAIQDLVERVQGHSLVVVVGPSGSGKSSLVLAGLLPALRKHRRTTMWDAVTLRPGKRPLHALVEAFAAAPDNAGQFEVDAWLEKEVGFLRAGDAASLARVVDRRLDAAPEKPDRLMIYVDQWEELYAMAPAPEDKEHVTHSADVEKFVELLVAAASGAGSRANIVMTVRADFYNPLIRNPRLASLLPKQQVNIPPMSREDLRSAIETPAKMAGLSFAPPKLVDRILEDVGLEEGRLPLLQFALKEIWGRQRGARLTAEAYTEVGGVAGAIEKTAQEAYERLTPSQRDAARRLFLRLVTPGEGQADTRARSVIPDDPEQRGVVSLFANPRTRLLVTGYEILQGATQSESGPRSTVEVAHEALIQRWPTLRTWVRANRDSLRARAAILRANAEWEEQGENETFLLDPGLQLERGRALLSSPGDVAVDDIRRYVDRSIEKDQRRLDAERERAIEIERRAKEAAEETAGQALDAAKKAARNAEAHLREAQIAQSRFLAAMAHQQRAAGDAGTALLLALEALPDVANGRQRPYVPEAELQLDSARRDLRERLVLRGGELLGAAYIRDAIIVTASRDGTTRLWDPVSGEPLSAPIQGPENRVKSAAFSADARRIVCATVNNTARVWETITGKPIGVPIKGHEKGVRSAAFSPDGVRIVSTSLDKTARIWDIATGLPIGSPFFHDDIVVSAAFSADGCRIVIASRDRTARVWDVADGREIGIPLVGHEHSLESVAFSADGGRVVTASSDKTARIWDASSGFQTSAPLEGHEDAVMSAAFSQDDQCIITASLDKTARIWNANRGTQIGEPFKGHEDRVIGASFSPDGRHIATVSADKTARVWDLMSGNNPLRAHVEPVWSVAFSPEGERIVTASFDKTAQVWDLETRSPIGTPLIGHSDVVRTAVFNPDGTRIFTASQDHTVRIWDAASGTQVGEPIKVHEGPALSAVFSRDCRRMVIISAGSMRLWEIQSGLSSDKPQKALDNIISVAFSPDGKRIVTASHDWTARVWDVDSGEPIGEPLRGHAGHVVKAAFSPNGRHVVTGSGDRTARLWDVVTGAPIGDPFEGHGAQVNSVAFSPDGKRIVTASADRTARVWDADSGQAVAELKGHDNLVWSAAFSPNGGRIATASADGTIRIWDSFPKTKALISRARSEVPRGLSLHQRKAFFLSPEPPLWCIEMEKWPYDTLPWKQWLTDKRAGKDPPMPAEPPEPGELE